MPCFQAAITPSGTATRIERIMVNSAIEIEGSTREAIRSNTGLFEIRDWPRSPCRSFPIQVTNWV